MEEFLHSCRTYWTNWLFGIIAAVLTARFCVFKKRQEQQRIRQQALEHGMRALLKDRLIQAYEHYVFDKEGHITLNGLGAVNDMYDSYAKFDDEDTIKRLVEKMRNLEIVT